MTLQAGPRRPRAAAANMRHTLRTTAVVEESLLFQQGEIGFRNGEVVLAHVAALGEDLRQIRQSVLLQQTLREIRLLAFGPQLVDLGSGIVGVLFVVNHGFQRQAVGQCGRFVGIAHDDGRDGNNPLRKLQNPRNIARGVDRRAEVADAQSVHLGLDAEVLRRQQGVGGAFAAVGHG